MSTATRLRRKLRVRSAGCLVIGVVLLVLAATASAEASFRVMLVLGGWLGLVLGAAFMVMLARLEYSAGRSGR